MLGYVLALGAGYLACKIWPKKDASIPAAPVERYTSIFDGAVPSAPYVSNLSTLGRGVMERILQGDASLSPQEITMLQGELGLPQTGDVNPATQAAIVAHTHAAAHASGYGMSGYGVSGEGGLTAAQRALEAQAARERAAAVAARRLRSLQALEWSDPATIRARRAVHESQRQAREALQDAQQGFGEGVYSSYNPIRERGQGGGTKAKYNKDGVRLN